MEQRGRADEVGTRLEGNTARGLGIFEGVNRGEMPIGQRRVGQRPQVLGGMELRRIGREEQQMDMLGHPPSAAGVPARAIQDQHDLFVRTGANRAGEGHSFGLEERDGDTGGEREDDALRGGMHKAGEGAPRIAVLVLDRREASPPFRG